MAIALRAGQASNNAGGGTTLTMTKPTGTVDGDVMLMSVTARGGTGTTITPPDSAWSSGTAPSSTTYRIRSGNGYFVIGSFTGGLYTATDPTGTWTANSSASTAFGATNTIQDLAYGNGYWVGVGSTRKICSCGSDPTGTWTNRYTSAGNNFYGVDYDGSTYWAAVDGAGNIVTSPADPTGTWTARGVAWSGSTVGRDIKYGGGYWVAVGDSGKIAYASDPTQAGTWSAPSSIGFGTSAIRAVAYDGSGTWIAVADGGKIGRATDPTGTWTQISNPAGANGLSDVAYYGGTWVVVGNGTDLVMFSTDGGSTWSLGISKMGSSAATGITCNGTTWAITGMGSTAKSTNPAVVGWQLLVRHDSTTVLGQAVYWKLASGEPSSYAVTLTSNKASGCIISLSGADTTLPVAAQYGQQANASSANCVAPALGSWTSVNGIDVGLFGTAYGSSFTAPTNYAEPANSDSASTGGSASTRTTSEGSYRALSAQTTVGSITAVAANAAVNIGFHCYVFEYTAPAAAEGFPYIGGGYYP